MAVEAPDKLTRKPASPKATPKSAPPKPTVPAPLKAAAEAKPKLSKVAALYQSLFRPELKATYAHPDIRELTERIELYEEAIKDPPVLFDEEGKQREEADVIAAYQEDLDSFKKRLAKLQAELPLPEVDCVFVKLTNEEYQSVQQESAIFTSRFIDSIRSDPDRKLSETNQLRLLLDSKGIFSDDVLGADSDGEEVAETREQMLNALVDQILSADGKPLEWATVIDEDDPEMELTEAEERELRPHEAWAEEEKVEFMLEVEDRKRNVLEAKKKRITETRLKEREERKEKLLAKGFDSLVEVLWNYKTLADAHNRGNTRQLDTTLYYAVRDPEKPLMKRVGGVEVLDTYGRLFTDVDELAFIRERCPDFYEWMTEKYYQLQEIRTQEDVERVAEDGLFRPSL